MGVYNNNKDGTRSTLANTIQVVDAPMEEFLSKGEFNAITPNDVGVQNKLVTENEVTKAVSTMPTASSSLVGTIVQYVGTTTANYTNGYFYRCDLVDNNYVWVAINGENEGYYYEGVGNQANVLNDTNNQASGNYSHAQNNHTIAQGESQTAIGRYNVPQGTAGSYQSTDYAFVVGNGTNDNNRSNAFAVKWDGTLVFSDGTEQSTAGGGADLPFVTPEQYGAKGDGVTDDTNAFTLAFAASKNVVCDGTKTYYFAGIVDASDLTDGDFNINNATLLNFHIKVGIKNTYEPKANYPYLSFKIHNGNIGTYSAIPTNWQTPAIQTGNAIDLDNIVFNNTPYIVALTNSYRDYNKFRNLTFNYYSALWADVASWDLDAISLIASDGSFVKINSRSVNTGIPSTTGKFSGDGWIIENVCQFISSKYTDYGFCHFYNNHTLNINRCVQTKFYFGTGTRVEVSNSHFESLVSMPTIETLSDATGTVGTTSNIQVDFDNCYFTDHYTLESDKNYVTYTNCYFRVAGDATDKTIPLATVFNNYDYYNMECSIVDSLIYRMPMNTNKWKGYKEQAKLTRNYRNNTSNESTMAESIQETKAIGSGDYKYPQTGTYNYVGFSFTNSAEIAHERYEWTRTVSSLSSAGDGSSTMVGLVGGWGFEIYRTLPDSTIQRARFYDSPVEENYKTVTNKQFAFRERGNYIIIHKWTIFSPSSNYIEEDFYIPWCTVSAIPSYTVNNKVYEKNGVLVTLDGSTIASFSNKPFAQVSDSYSSGGSGSGDMLASVYDPNGTVADAGGIDEYIKDNAPRYNVLDYGLKGDKTTDNTTALRNLIATIPNGSVIFFPIGTYMISEGIEINKDVTFLGENQEMQSAGTASNRLHDPMSIIKYGGNTENVTMFTKASGYYDVNFVNLTLDGGNSYDVTDNWTGTFTTLPFYNQVEAVNLDGINGLDLSILSPGIVKNCMFWGFSGYGIKVAQHKYVERCGFLKCKKGIVTVFSDSLLHDLWFCKSGTAIYMLPKENDYFASVSLSDVWADQLIDHLVEADSSVTSAQIITDNVWVDSVGKSAFYLPEATISKAHIQGTFGRIGMDYAGIADADRTSALAKYTDFMACGRLRYSTLNLNISNETIGKGSNANGECFSRLITTYKTNNNNDYNKIICNSLPVARLYDSNTQPQYSYFVDTEYNGTDGKISIYGNATFVDGFYTYNLSPIGRIKAPNKDFLVYDRLAKKLYRSTAADDNNAWVEIVLPEPDPSTDIDFTTLLGGN